MRAIFDSLGVHDIVAKSLGSSNVYAMIAATFDALLKLSSPKIIAERRGKKMNELLTKHPKAVKYNNVQVSEDNVEVTE